MNHVERVLDFGSKLLGRIDDELQSPAGTCGRDACGFIRRILNHCADKTIKIRRYV